MAQLEHMEIIVVIPEHEERARVTAEDNVRDYCRALWDGGGGASFVSSLSG